MSQLRFVLVIFLAACATKEKPGQPAGATVENKPISLAEATAGLPAGDKLIATITTDLGAIECELYPQAAPETVASFVGLARGLRAWQDPKSGAWVKRPFYDGLAFHRVIPDFMIQGGDPLSVDYGRDDVGSGGPGYTLPDELSADLRFDRPGRMAMANTGPRTHSGGSQFFITDGPYPSLDGGYVVFGQCTGTDVVRAIARVPTGANDKPARAVTMKVAISRR